MIAVVNDGMSKMRWKTAKLGPCSVMKLSTSRMASGYRIKSVRNAMSTTMVVTMMGSAMSFLRSSSAPWDLAIVTLPHWLRDVRAPGG